MVTNLQTWTIFRVLVASDVIKWNILVLEVLLLKLNDRGRQGAFISASAVPKYGWPKEDTGQTTVRQWAPIHYNIPVNDMVDRSLLKRFFFFFNLKSPQNSPRPSNLIHTNKTKQVCTSQSADKHSCAGLKMQTPIHSHSMGCPKNSSPLCSNLKHFFTGYRIWHASWAWKLKTSKKPVDFHTAKNVQKQATFLLYS